MSKLTAVTSLPHGTQVLLAYWRLGKSDFGPCVTCGSNLDGTGHQPQEDIWCNLYLGSRSIRLDNAMHGLYIAGPGQRKVAR
jgi:hypothetical protein